jgi:hypothetical protein
MVPLRPTVTPLGQHAKRRDIVKNFICILNMKDENALDPCNISNLVTNADGNCVTAD